MKKAEIQIGGRYIARVSGNLVTVQVDAIREANRDIYRGYKARSETLYDVTNLATGRKLTFRSAAKFRSEVAYDAHAERLARTFYALGAHRQS